MRISHSQSVLQALRLPGSFCPFFCFFTCLHAVGVHHPLGQQLLLHGVARGQRQLRRGVQQPQHRPEHRHQEACRTLRHTLLAFNDNTQTAARRQAAQVASNQTVAVSSCSSTANGCRHRARNTGRKGRYPRTHGILTYAVLAQVRRYVRVVRLDERQLEQPGVKAGGKDHDTGGADVDKVRLEVAHLPSNKIGKAV